MLTCRDVTEHATDYMEGSLTLRMRFAMRLHLAVCRMCRAYLLQLQRTTDLLRGRGLAAPAPETETGIVERARDAGG